MEGRFTIRMREHWTEWLGTLEGRVSASAAAHLLAVAVVANAWWFGAHKLRPVGSPNGSKRLMVYDSSATLPQHSDAHKSPIHTVRPPRRPVVSPAQIPDLAEATAGGSEQALGNGEVSIAYVQAFPAQKPDLAGIGPTGDIKLDVLIDATGHIARIRARTGMTDSIDRMVIATVEQWVFQPAMRDGHPVSSSEELHFHYDGTRNPASCGWECFTLEAQ